MSNKSRVLAVDDNQTNLMLYEELLDEFYELETAEDGREALEKVAEFQPDIVLLDIMMPGMSGYEVCSEIRKLPKLGASVKVILVSAKNTTADRIVGYESGADDYLIKPFDEDELEAKLKVFLKLKSMEEIDQLKSNVMALFSSETRTPLNGIVGPLQLLRSGNDSSTAEDRLKWINLVHDSAKDLQSLVDKVMLLSRLRSEQHQLQLGKVSTEFLLSQVVYAGKVLSDAREVSLEVGADVSADLNVDRELISNCLNTILMQSLNLSKFGGKVVLESRQNAGQVEILFTGCDRRADPQVLEALMDADEGSKHADLQGASLSLSIAKEVARLHQGKIAAANDEQGTVLSLTLPVAV
ncbi:MAG: hybrid sensor histidine kinase/response regulator [Pseudomonadota bacterium]